MSVAKGMHFVGYVISRTYTRIKNCFLAKFQNFLVFVLVIPINLMPIKAFNKMTCAQGSHRSPNNPNYDSNLLLVMSVTTGVHCKGNRS